MAEQDVLSSPSPPEPRRTRSVPGLRRLTDRTPLRTKLIASVLALVVMALAAISVASVIVLQSYLYTQRDPQLQGTFNGLAGTLEKHPNVEVDLNVPYTAGPNIIAIFQNPGDQIQRGNDGGTPPPGMGATPRLSLPELPTGKN